MCQELSWPVKNPENLDETRECRKWNIYYHTQLNPRNNPFHKILSPPPSFSPSISLALSHTNTQANACVCVSVVYVLQAAFCTYTHSILYMSCLINCLGVDVCVTLPWARGSVPVSLFTINDDYLAASLCSMTDERGLVFYHACTVVYRSNSHTCTNSYSFTHSLTLSLTVLFTTESH